MMSVSRRLLLSLAPAIVGLAAAVGLAYYGEYERQAPEWFVAVALVSGVTSLVAGWRVTRQVALRIERLADWHNTQGGALQRAALALEAAGNPIASTRWVDELDTIAHIVDTLTTEYTRLRIAHEDLATTVDAQRTRYAGLVKQAADEVLARLEEVRLPLHILLENHFGELNENQEEMLAAARHAAETADQAALGLREIAVQDLAADSLRSLTDDLSATNRRAAAPPA